MLDTKALGAIVSGPDLDRMTLPPLAWVVQHIIAEGLTLLVAPPKAGKSFLVYKIALARASGGEVLGLPVQQGPVLYLALEDGWRRLQERGRKLLDAGQPIPTGIDYIIRLDPAVSVLEKIRSWMDLHRGMKPLVIVDTFGKVKPPAGASASAYDHDYKVMGGFKSLTEADPGSAIILVHHDRKATSDDFMDSVSGTNGIAGAADTTIVIRRARTEGDAVISITGRDVMEKEYAASFDGGHWQLAGGGLDAAQSAVALARATKTLGSDRSIDIVKLVHQHPAGITRKDIDAKLGLGNQLGPYLKRLSDEGHIANPSRGTYTPVTTVTSVTGTYAPITTITSVTSEAGQLALHDQSNESNECNGPTGQQGVTNPPAAPEWSAAASLSTTKACGHPGKPLTSGKCGSCIADQLAGNAA